MSQTPFIEALRSQLGQINLDGVTRPEGTQLLSKCVRKMSSGMGFRCFPNIAHYFMALLGCFAGHLTCLHGRFLFSSLGVSNRLKMALNGA